MADPLLMIQGLRKEFPLRGRGERRLAVHAVDGIDLEVGRGEVLGLVGESGCGKSTVAWCVTGLHQPTDGKIWFDGKQLELRRDRSQRRRIQMVFQDPDSSLNPRMTVGHMLREVLQSHRMRPRDQITDRAAELVELVGMGPSTLKALPRQLSGGQRQRVSIARALALEPELLVADEPVSSLDVSVQATILNLLQQLQSQLDLTMLFIAHDLSVVRHISDRVAVMYLGRIVEISATQTLFENPRHPYTQGLLRSIPNLHGGPLGRDAAVKGELPSPVNIPPGCRFHTRCPLAQKPVCLEVDPHLTVGDVDRTHAAACHFAWIDQDQLDTATNHPTGISG